MPKRKPIAYTAQFVPGVFRDPEEVERERDALATELEAALSVPLSHDGPNQRAADDRTSDQTDGQSNGRSNGRTVERSNGQQRVASAAVRINTRHSFDVWQDQLQALTDIQAQRFAATGKKPKVGDLVKEALDAYVAKVQKGARDRTNG